MSQRIVTFLTRRNWSWCANISPYPPPPPINIVHWNFKAQLQLHNLKITFKKIVIKIAKFFIQYCYGTFWHYKWAIYNKQHGTVFTKFNKDCKFQQWGILFKFSRINQLKNIFFNDVQFLHWKNNNVPIDDRSSLVHCAVDVYYSLELLTRLLLWCLHPTHCGRFVRSGELVTQYIHVSASLTCQTLQWNIWLSNASHICIMLTLGNQLQT